MRILHVIHGYPPRYNAGSEVYTQTLCHAQAERHEVHVFTREENPFAPECALRVERDRDDPRVHLHVVNVPHSRERYRHPGVDQRFAQVLDQVDPHVVHVGHLSHLSTSLVPAAAAREIPVVFTLHDFWLMCPRGQFIQTHPADPSELWAVCDGQEDRKCAERCYARCFSGAEEEWEVDTAHWTGWVSRRMRHVREVMERVDLFVAPSRHLLRRFHEEMGVHERRLVHLDYGFDRARLAGRRRDSGEPLTFGYIGTHIPAKGVHDLIRAFGQVPGNARLRIWGRPRGQETDSLRDLARGLPGGAGDRVEWMGEYRNQDIVPDVFNRVDAIVVPSVWDENSPLVIHEAQQARVPVITSDAGGMAELVHDGVNGLCFQHRLPGSLARQMQRLASDPALAACLGARGYAWTENGDVPGVREHADRIDELYGKVRSRRDRARVSALPGPWRITLDTNPDTCNLRCIMCEEHSVHSTLQRERRNAGRPRRVMPLETVRTVLAQAAGRGLREVIPSTMGEPLLYEHFDAIVDLCHEHGVKLNLTTNGTFPGRGARTWAERLVPITSDVKVSWNGATRETHERIMPGTRWPRVLENVRTLVEVRDAHAAAGGNRCRVTFQLTFLESNVAELGDIVRLAAAMGVDRVKGHHLWVHFREIAPLSMRRDAAARARWNQAVLHARQAAAETVLPNGEHVLLENFFVLDEPGGEPAALDGPCPFLGQEAWVSAEGRFDPCCAPDAQRRTLGEFGTLQTRALHEIWEVDAYRELVHTYRNRSLCQGCTMRRPAREDA